MANAGGCPKRGFNELNPYAKSTLQGFDSSNPRLFGHPQEEGTVSDMFRTNVSYITYRFVLYCMVLFIS